MMKVAKSLLHKITNQTEIFNATLDIYNDALAYVIEIIDKEFDDTESLTTKSIVPAVEKLIHATKSNPQPKYKEFNDRFHKFPSYFAEVPLLLLLAK
jgi:putative transposase